MSSFCKFERLYDFVGNELCRRTVALVLVIAAMTGCAGSLPESKVAKVEQVTVDTAVELCVLAHGVNEQTNTGAKLDEMRDKIDAVCMPALKAMMTVEGLDIVKAVAQLQAALKEVLQ